jgi:transposase
MVPSVLIAVPSTTRRCTVIAEPAYRIAAEVCASEVVASDETSARVKGKTWWQWTFGCATAVAFVMAESRGKCVPTSFLAGARPKMWLSDRLPARRGRLSGRATPSLRSVPAGTFSS